jgi:ATP-dependent helicase/nuclease subunit B
MKLLLSHLEIDRSDVIDWAAQGNSQGNLPGNPPKNSRSELLRQALLPASVTGAPIDPVSIDPASLDGVKRIDCPDPGKESETIALIMRQCLETPGKTAALITPDRTLARRVRGELKRWDIDVDDSAGTPLSQTPPGTFLRLCASMIARDLPPLDMLAALKHPLSTGGLHPAEFRTKVRQLEKAALRGARPASGFAGLRASIDTKKFADCLAFVDHLKDLTAPFTTALNQNTLSLKDLLKSHIEVAERLAADHETDGVNRLWQGDAGEALSSFVAELYDALTDNDGIDIQAHNYPALFNTLLMGRAVRPRHGAHPRLNIWGPMEARLQHADVLILGSLNEGSWPREPDPGPWMSRPMMAAFGLPLPERRIGLSAHDFAQAFCAPNVILTRSERNDGTPTVPSRWLRRIENLIKKAPMADTITADQEWLSLAMTLDHPDQRRTPEQPRPSPPVDARPRRLSVTRVRTLQRDPYSIYAREILRLRPLDEIDADPGAADRGIIIHGVLEDFIKQYPRDLPTDAERQLIQIGEQHFAPYLARPGIKAFWWPRFLRVAKWFIENEEKLRASDQFSVVTESRGMATFPISTGEFKLTAIADRIDTLGHGGLAIIDYKTGAPPSAKQVETEFEPQLPLEAAIINHGAFEGLPAAKVEQLSYYKLSGGREAGKIHHLRFDVEDVSEKTWLGFKGLIKEYDNPDKPYLSHTRPVKQNDYGDYDHLARVKEWKSVEDDE